MPDDTAYQVTGDGYGGQPSGCQPFSLQPPEPGCQLPMAEVPNPELPMPVPVTRHHVFMNLSDQPSLWASEPLALPLSPILNTPYSHLMSPMPSQCPECTMTEIISHATLWECATCGHEWEKTAAELGEGAPAADGPRVVKDANGSVLADGDTVVLIKDLKLRGSAGTLKGGTKAKNIRLVDGDHEIDCKIDGAQIGLKACYVKKA